MAVRATDTDGEADTPNAAAPARAAADHRNENRRGLLGRWLHNPSVVALVVWLLASPIALVAPGRIDANPFTNRSWALVYAAAFLAVGVVAAIGLRWTVDAVAGAAAGLLAAWVLFALRMALHGTEYGFGGLIADAGRMAAMANRYTTTMSSSDTWVPGIVSEYPPLYPWLIGRASVLFDVPPWHMLAIVQCVTISAAVLVAFMLWRRLIPAWVALAAVAVSLVSFGDPRKAYEVVALYAFVPWAIATFGRPPKGRLHWLPAGIIGGLILQTYLGWFLFGALGILTMAFLAWRRTTDRREFLWHLVKVIAVATIVGAWYLGPYAWGMATSRTNAISDKFEPLGVNLTVFTFIDSTPLGLLQLIGLAGLVWYARKTWWAPPLLALSLGAFAYRVIATLRYAVSGHTEFLQYTFYMYSTVLAIAGVLVLAHAGPRLIKRLDVTAPKQAAAGVLALAMLWVPYTYSRQWFPAGHSGDSIYTAQAHLEPSLEGGYSRFAPTDARTPWLPVEQIRDRVEAVLGPNARPMTLSSDERLFVYLSWPGYMGTARLAANSLGRWDDRAAELRTLAATTDPVAFARDSAATAFGPIDVFILTRDGDSLRWAAGIRFSQAQFDPAIWAIADDLPNNVVVFTRRP